MPAPNSSIFGRYAVFVYGLVVYVLFLATFSYMIGFVGNVVVPKSIDTVSGPPLPIWQALLINAGLLSLFVVQHTIMARPAFKRRWTRIIPVAAERSTFVLATCLVLGAIVWNWQAMPLTIWSIENSVASVALHALCALGWLLVLYSTFCIDHFDLFGLRQVTLYLLGRKYTGKKFVTPWLYKLVRNPLMLGFLIAFWATPNMTLGRLVFACLTTGYMFLGIWFEERDLLRYLGDDYRRYRERTPMLLPWPRRGAHNQLVAVESEAAN